MIAEQIPSPRRGKVYRPQARGIRSGNAGRQKRMTAWGLTRKTWFRDTPCDVLIKTMPRMERTVCKHDRCDRSSQANSLGRLLGFFRFQSDTPSGGTYGSARIGASRIAAKRNPDIVARLRSIRARDVSTS
jgi:hypothetical protein